MNRQEDQGVADRFEKLNVLEQAVKIPQPDKFHRRDYVPFMKDQHQ